jgi:hypothetical protein
MSGWESRGSASSGTSLQLQNLRNARVFPRRHSRALYLGTALVPRGRLKVVQEGIAPHFQRSLRDWSSFQIQPRTGILG